MVVDGSAASRLAGLSGLQGGAAARGRVGGRTRGPSTVGQRASASGLALPRACAATHVLLPVSCLLHRLDAVKVIGVLGIIGLGLHPLLTSYSTTGINEYI